jgi:hypothetical protein
VLLAGVPILMLARRRQHETNEQTEAEE